MMGEFIDSSLDPKQPIRKRFHMTWKCLEFCIPILGGLPEPQILEAEMVDLGGPVKTHLTTKCPYFQQGGKLTSALQLSGRYTFSVFSRCLVLIGETYLLNSGHFFGFFSVNFELIQHSPSIATSRT